MSLRDEFEKLCPRPEGVEWRPAGYYAGGATGMCYQEKYQGFLLGRRNTVSVCRCGSIPRLTSKERDHRDYHMTLCPSCGDNTGWHRSEEDSIARWNDRQAKRRTEEV